MPHHATPLLWAALPAALALGLLPAPPARASQAPQEPTAARPAMPMGMQHGMRHDDDHMADMQVFHTLLERRAEIRRSVTLRPDGVETLTESDAADLAGLIKGHVASMYRRVAEGRPIHQRDPLFREVFAHREKIRMEVEQTSRGVRVVEHSDDPYVASLIQAHARVVDLFVANGMKEMHTDHAVPPRKQ